MRKKKLIVSSLVMAAVMAMGASALTGCNPQQLTDEPLKADKIADYTKTAAERAETFASGSKGYSWENGGSFNVWWNPKNVSYEGGKMSLSISEMTVKEQKWDEEKQENVDVNADYYGAEERSEHYYGYGDFQVRMKPAKIVGTASTFFTCTGPYDKWYNEDGTEVIKENQHDEIDIEFLGKDTTKVQFNYFVNGQGGHEYLYNLGFDASVEFHDYGYRWTENYITWFVDNKPVYRVDRNGNEAWPSHPGRIIMNYWCGTTDAVGWMGKFADDYSGKAEYEYVAASATQCPDPNTAHIKEDTNPPEEVTVPTQGWTDIDYSNFGGWSGYEIDKTTGLTISHIEKMGAWACEGMDLADSYSWVKFKLKNNADVAADLRIDIKDKDNNVSAVEAVSPASDDVKVVAADSVGTIHIDANAELEVAFKLKNVFVNQFVIFLNSTPGADAEKGNVTITGLKGIISNNVEKPEPVENPPLKIGANEVTFGGDYRDITVSEDGTAMTVEYADVLGKSYKNANASIADFVGNNDVLAFTVKNNGTETVKIRIDIGCDTADGSSQNNGTKNNFCNIKAEYTGTVVASGNDYEWGGADWVQIAAGETVNVKITFTKSVAKDIKFYLDSSTYDDETTHSGNVTFSGFALSEKIEVPSESSKLTFTSTEEYTVDKSGQEAAEINVQYTAVTGATYKNIQAPVASLAADNNTFALKIKNNGTESVTLRVDLIGENKITVGENSNMECCNLSSVAVGGSGSYTDTTWGGTMITIAAGEEATLTITYSNTSDIGAVQRVQIYLDSSTYGDEATHSGDVTFSEFKFTSAE